ncbi:MAG: glycosyl transferase, partial [Candidatus Dadabacteria bacterium]
NKALNKLSPLIKENNKLTRLCRRLDGFTSVYKNRPLTFSLLARLLDRLLKIAADLPEEGEVSKCRKLLIEGVEKSLSVLEKLVRQSSKLSEQIEKLFKEIDFSFLYDKERGLFVIGYDVESSKPDKSYYDLLASECRLTSLVAIAKGDVPIKHWFRLGRMVVNTSGGRALVSWTGTMFEYLTPLLFNKSYPGTLITNSCIAAVKAQIAYGRQKKIPWGISESGYSGVDFETTYQYRAFGVPELGLKRGLADDLVVSPYSTFLALMVLPHEAVKNIKRLQRYGARGQYGFYEAIDFTPDRLAVGEKFHIVKSFLAHHQGMSFVSLCNVLKNGIFQERFHKNSIIKAVEILLQEKFPWQVPGAGQNLAEAVLTAEEEEKAETIRRVNVIEAVKLPVPRTHLLSNGKLLTVVDHEGAGYLGLANNFLLTNWEEDATVRSKGIFVYLRDLEEDLIWSATALPFDVKPEFYRVTFSADKAEFLRRDLLVTTRTDITVSPEDNVEIRRISFHNNSDKFRSIEVTTYGEVVLNDSKAHWSHPVFSKMFIEAKFIRECDGLLFKRRPRSRKDPPQFMFHMFSLKVCWAPTEYLASREMFLGREGTIFSPSKVVKREPLGNIDGFVIDPIFSLRTLVSIAPQSNEEVFLITGYAESEEEALELMQKYHLVYHPSRAFELAWNRADVELRHEQYNYKQFRASQYLANAILYNIEALRGEPYRIRFNRFGQTALWKFGISGDLPIVLCLISELSETRLVKELLVAYEFLQKKGIDFDLVIVNQDLGGYMDAVQKEIQFIVEHSWSAHSNTKGKVHILRFNDLTLEERTLLHTTARAVLDGGRGTLSQQLEKIFEEIEQSEIVINKFSFLDSHEGDYKLPKISYQCPCGLGGFIDDGATYLIPIKQGKLPPQPWSNIIANPYFGFLVTESGGGYTWSENSREHKLTPWRNDPVTDERGEIIYIRDVESGKFWCPTPKPLNEKRDYLVKHTIGASFFETKAVGIKSSLAISGSIKDPVKWWRLSLTNESEETRYLDLYLYIEPVLGVDRQSSYRYIVSEWDRISNILSCSNHYNDEFPQRVLFIGSSHKIIDFTGSRRDFLGIGGSYEEPAVFSLVESGNVSRAVGKLSKRVGAGFDPALVLRVRVEIEPKKEEEILFFMGAARSVEEAERESKKYKEISYCKKSLEKVRDFWQKKLTTIQVNTPNKALNVILNYWLLYQNISSRLFARTAFYQCGGAFGFRDQLQDVSALLWSWPEKAKEQILLHASRQFVEGDVQHWWHPPSGKGVRTKISDDYLWLPFVVARYLEVTGDYSILDEEVNFLEGDLLAPDQHEIYMVPRISQHKSTIYEHCIIALDRALLQFGKRDLPLIGAGDWNDGMNEVGIEGKGESVWLAWFLTVILKQFCNVVGETRKDRYRAQQYERVYKDLIRNAEAYAWDGKWYLRAFFDDDTPLGSHKGSECKIDSLSQSWAAFAGANEERVKSALSEAEKWLVDREHKIIKLLTPPFDKGDLEPGYIKGYLPGIRENGGQYTHAATWLIKAFAEKGEGNKAVEFLEMINPVEHCKDEKGVKTYRTEPYVLCGDVYSYSPYEGRGGWSWYTGSAGWYYQVAIETVLG